MVEAETASFANLLKRYRSASGLTQEELAERAGLSARAISDLERGVKRYPYLYTVRRLQEALALEQDAADAFESAARRPRGTNTSPDDMPTVGRDRPPLPIPPTLFVGRVAEVEEISALISREEDRLVTLVGAGGVGKTRLGLRVAEIVSGLFPNGVVFVSLAALTDPAHVLSAIASTIGVTEQPGQPLLEVLIGRLARKRLLLVIDNFEHLLPAAEDVARLLVSCPQLTVLATSRSVLHLSGEHEFVVNPLAVPDHQAALDTVSHADAVRLFTQRAEGVNPRFRITTENAAAIALICRRLDGLPLAIELAAARVRYFSPQAMLDRLHDRLDLLTGGPRDVPARQQTLRSTIDWSYSLLSDDLQRLFCQLSVFAGGWTVDAAEAVCGLGGQIDVWNGLESLAEQSLLVVDDVEGEPRFRMLETIRQNASEHLAAEGDSDRVRGRHAEAFLRLAEEVECERTPVTRTAWLRRLQREHDNFRLALAWGLSDEGDPNLALRLSNSLAWFWSDLGWFSEGRGWLERSLTRCTSSIGTDAPQRAHAQALVAIGQIAQRQFDLSTAHSYVEQGLSLWRALGDRDSITSTLALLGWVAQRQGDLTRGQTAFTELSDLTSEDSTLRDSTIEALNGLATVRKQRGHLEHARALHQEALTLTRREGGRERYTVMTLVNLEEVAWAQGDADAQRAYYTDAVATMGTMTEPVDRASLLGVMIWIACRVGEYDQATTFSQEELARSGPDSVNGLDVPPSSPLGLGEVARCRGDFRQAASLLEASVEFLRDHGERSGLAAALHNLGHVVLAEADTSRARALFLESISLFRSLGFTSGVTDCVVGLAGIAGLEGKPELAALLYGAAETANNAIDMSGTFVTPANVRARAWEMATARGETDEETWNAAMRAGRALSIDEALTRSGFKSANTETS